MQSSSNPPVDKASIRKELVVLKTYPYSDPSPIPEFGRLYPYNRFDGYTHQPIDQAWEMVIMENNYIKIWINPSVGGKIWGAIEKSSGKEFIYFNHTAKFRDVAMRGPWTSGGMEINMGIIGHSPSCSSAVDYKMVENKDGSVSCFIGATDWPSRTEWRVEIILRKDAAYFTTRSWWNNNSCLPQSYYQWNNAGIKTSGNLEYIFPGNRRLAHDGSPLSWPVDEEDRKISFYDQNNFGEYKSYHITGSYTDFWGCYWHEDQFGLGHTSSYADKPGKKIWIWGLSRYGMIWEDLLTDNDGQYSEVQSGRLFNQSIAASSQTPFKHRSFLPYTFDSWEEHWFPVKNTGGLTYGNQQLSFHITTDTTQKKKLNLCANETLNYTLKLIQDKKEVLSEKIQMKAMDNCTFDLPDAIDAADILVFLDDTLIYNGPEQHQPLNRPEKIAATYDFNSAQALYIQAKEWERQRFSEKAIDQYHRCLQEDPFFLEALTGLAGLFFKQMRFKEALALLLTALSVDTYHAEANYLYGLVNDRLNHPADAKDGFSIASQSADYRVAAFIELAKIFLREQQINKAHTYLLKAQHYHATNLQISYLTIIINRLRGNIELSASLCKDLLAHDPINYLAKFELSLAEQSLKPEGLQLPTNQEKLTDSELAYETYIELAAYYADLNLYETALKSLAPAPDYAMVELWRAYLHHLSGHREETLLAITKASRLETTFVFPHREEDIQVLEWAVSYHENYKFNYYLAISYLQNLRKEEALALLERCANLPDFYTFYIVRANLRLPLDEIGALKDLNQAFEYAPKEWRTTWHLSKYFSEKQDWKKAVSITEKGYKLYPDNYYLGLQLAKCLMHTHDFEKGIDLMNHIRVLPNEGASEGRISWRETHLFCALAAIDNQDWEKATHYLNEARKWPENMGIGKPYHVDERLEDYLQLICTPSAQKEAQKRLINQIISYRDHHQLTPYGSTDFLSLLFLQKAGELAKSAEIISNWSQQDPDPLTLNWAQAFLQGDLAEIDKLSAKELPAKHPLPYEILFEDRSFLFIKKSYEKGLFAQYTPQSNHQLNH